MKRKNIVITLFLISSLFAQTYIDVVLLKNGDVIKGKIIENVINDHIRIELQGGSILSYQYHQIESIEVEKKSTRTFGSGNNVVNPIINTTSIQDCYKDGYASGQSIGTGGQILGGFISGFALGLIGWGISYAIVANGNPKPPYQEIKSYDDNCKSDYESGYKEGALKVKKSSVTIGGALGTIMIVNILLSGY
jgi:hypothetical protein